MFLLTLLALAAGPAAAAAPDAAALVQAVADRIDAVRDAEGLPPLGRNDALAKAAAAHSAEMAQTGTLSHRSADGRTVADRIAAAGYGPFAALAENVAFRTVAPDSDPETLARLIVGQWLDSPGHRANLLGTATIESGVGVAFGGDAVYMTQVFAAPQR